VEAERGGDPVTEDVFSPHVVVGAVDVEVPASLIEKPKPPRRRAKHPVGETVSRSS